MAGWDGMSLSDGPTHSVSRKGRFRRSDPLRREGRDLIHVGPRDQRADEVIKGERDQTGSIRGWERINHPLIPE